MAESIQSNMWLAPFLALLAGVLTSFTPCSLSNVPLIIGYVGGVGEKNTKKAFGYSVLFALGTAFTFITLGLIATSAGKLIGISSQIWYLLLGILMVLMALQTWEIFQIIPSVNLLSKSKAKGAVGAFVAGIHQTQKTVIAVIWMEVYASKVLKFLVQDVSLATKCMKIQK